MDAIVNLIEKLSASDWFALFSALVAIVSLFINFYVIRRQLGIQAEQVSAAIDAEKGRWLADVLHAFGDAAALVQSRLGVYTDHEFKQRRLDVANRLSVLADQGRLYFPNFSPEARGAEKPSAYRGARQPVLDGVILAFDVVRCLDRLHEIDEGELLDILFDLRRVVVSEVQFSTDPRRRETVLTLTRMVPAEQTSDSKQEIQKLLARVGQLPLRKVSFE
ncbi:MAG: hypothetical protein MRY74_10310 [Neomegalonema sp.]|nr:hypothetical protein [Neomegalonema sp.]